MRSIGPLRRLFFIKGSQPTDAEREEASQLSGRVSFRNALLVDNDGGAALEECDSVHGEVPPRYARAYPSDASGDVSGVGALRTVHDGEAGVDRGQAVHLDSRSTGDAVEEERRRAYRGPSVGAPDAAKAEPGRLDPVNGWGLPYGIPGAATLTTGEVSQVRSEQQGTPGTAAGSTGGWQLPASMQAAPEPATGSDAPPAGTTDAGAGSAPPAAPAGFVPAPTA